MKLQLQNGNRKVKLKSLNIKLEPYMMLQNL